MNCALVYLALAVASPDAANVERTKILVLDFTSDQSAGLDAGAVRGLTGLAVSHLTSIAALDVVSQREVGQLIELESDKAKLGCTDESCLNEIAAAMGTRLVLITELSRVGSFVILTTSLFDNEKVRIVSRRSLRGENLDQLTLSLDKTLDDVVSNYLGTEVHGEGAVDVTAPEPGDAELGPQVDGGRRWNAAALGGLSGGVGYGVGVFVAASAGVFGSQTAAGGSIGSGLGTLAVAPFYTDVGGMIGTSLLTSLSSGVLAASFGGIWYLIVINGNIDLQAFFEPVIHTGGVVGATLGGAVFMAIFTTPEEDSLL